MLLLIADDAPPGPEWRDYPLKGGWIGHRERQVGGDFLLIYRMDEAGPGGIVLVGTET